MQVLLSKSAAKELDKITKGDINSSFLIKRFLIRLEESNQPKNLPNAKKLQGFDERYRWRVGDYRIVGLVKDKELIIQIIKIATRQSAYE